VVVVENFLENNNTHGQENYLIIQHTNGTIASYYHLTQDGIDVEVGDLVSQGDIVTQSGNTGDSSEPHLHFEVALCEDCDTLPVNFKNTREHSKGLILDAPVFKSSFILTIYFL
jgi:murein DD-endopeptidase MepM/ murein hydrolase activator NlpD